MILTRAARRVNSRFAFLGRVAIPTARISSQARLLRDSPPGPNGHSDAAEDPTESVDKEKASLTTVQRLALELQAERDKFPTPQEERDPWEIKPSFRDFEDEVDPDSFVIEDEPYELPSDTYLDESPWASDTRPNGLVEFRAGSLRRGPKENERDPGGRRHSLHQYNTAKHDQRAPREGQSLVGGPKVAPLVPRQLSVVFSNPRITVSYSQII